MAMNVTKTNIIAEPTEVFVAERTSESTAVTLPSLAEVNAGGSATWKYVGGCKEGTVKIGTDVFSEELQDGTLKQTGLAVKLEADGMESDVTKIQLLEGFIDKTIDVLLRVVGGSKVHRIQRLGITVGYEGMFSRKGANKVKLAGQRHVDKFTNAYDVQTLS